MKQAELYAPEQIRLITASRPEPEPDEILIAVARVGVCGSDLHAYHGRHPYIQLPVVPGHEFAGTIVEVGADVHDFSPGLRVTVEPSLACGVCYNCTHGRYNICESLKVIGCQTSGAMAHYVSVPAGKAIRLPDDMSWDQAVFVEPLAVAVHAVRVAQLQPRSKVFIFGAGTIGLMTMQAAKAFGAEEIMVSDPIRERRELALALGATHTVDPGSADLDRTIEEAFGPHRADVVIECVGVAATVRDAIRIARKGTRIVVAGVFEEEIPVNLGLVQDRELELVGTLMYHHDDFPSALRLIHTGQVRIDPFITHRYPLEQTARAFATADSRQGALKVLIEVEH